MRKIVAAPLAASKTSLAASHRDAAPVELVCLTLALAILALACRIVSIW
jgi:hypothetical protein